MPSFLARLADRLLRRRAAGAGAAASAARGAGAAARQGLWGEREAERWLVRETGMRCVGRRVRVGRDEIDLVMEDRGAGGRETVFVEVKARSSDAFGGGLAAVARRKRRALGRAAARYMRRRPAEPFRIDVVEVVGSASRGAPDRVLHFRAAVPLDGRWIAPALGRRT